jgi:hypothetical protein
VFHYEFRREWQIPMPIDDLPFIVASGGAHMTPSGSMHHTGHMIIQAIRGRRVRVDDPRACSAGHDDH